MVKKKYTDLKKNKKGFVFFNMSKTRKGIKISQVSKYLESWEKYMPNDITKEEIKQWKKDHKEATESGFLPIPIDVTYPGCYIASRIRKEKLLPEHEIQELLFTLGRTSFVNMKNSWKHAMEQLEELRENKA